MKLALMTSALLISLALPGTAFAASKTTCKVVTHDIGTIVGSGRSISAAFEDAATQCFDRRDQLYRMKKGSAPDEDTALAMIDVCANITCGS